MHELAIAESLIEEAAEAAARAGASRVRSITCRIGALRQIDERLLIEVFELARRGTTCEAAVLRIEKTALQAVCPRCNLRYPVDDWLWQCPRCGVAGRGVSGGDELELASIEAEVDDEN